MILKELIRLSTQHRTLYCYLILSIWIFLLIAGMYKYIGNTNYNNSNLSFLNGKHNYGEHLNGEASKFRKYKQHCSPIENIVRRDDGGLLEGWQLQGILLIIRHGDRGPMSHVRGISSVNCGIEGDTLLNKYRTFINNSTNQLGSSHANWSKVGPFHGFALLPSTEKTCLLGQLTYKGIAQLLHVGEILHQVYAHQLGLLLKPKPLLAKGTLNSTPHSFLNSEEVIVYSTRYRRTFQSAMALMFSFLPLDKWISLNIRESHSMAFCFSDCACPRVDELRKKLSRLSSEQLTQHPAVAAVVQWVGQSLLQHTSNGVNNPHEVRDAVLALMCHNSPLPCKKSTSNNAKTLLTVGPPTTADNNDVINIDQEEIVLNAVDPASLVDTDTDGTDSQPEGCIESSHIAALMSYTNWQAAKEARHKYYRRSGLLRAYGMIRHIVGYMLKMISGDRTKFVLYSGHDWTMQYLSAALGINTETSFIPYASRIAFELYKSKMDTQYYFRVIYSGKDVTQQIDFCEGGKSLRVTRDSRGNKADLCPIENIIRFIHDDYFSPLNATNFKDACTIQKPSGF